MQYDRSRVSWVRFQRAWHKVGRRARRSWYGELVRRYGEPVRAYHTLDHVAAVLRELDRARHVLPRDRAVVALALWYHDAVYVPGRTDNEARSARLFERHARSARLQAAVRARISELILVTQTHRATAGDVAAAYVCDLDLAMLAAPARCFARYERGVQREYRRACALDEAAYCAARRAFVAALLARPRLFVTPELFARYEAAARANLCRYNERP